MSPDTGWRAPETLPVLDSRIRRLAFDCESDGTDWHGESRAVGFSFCLEDRRKFYLPTGHRGGGNLDPQLVRRWMATELRGKELVVLSGKFDIQMARKSGVDLEALGCNIREVQHKAALLSDQRRSFKMDDLLFDFLGRRKTEIDRSKIWELPAYVVGPYAENDALDTLDLDDAIQPKIDAEELNRVLDLEDSLIYCTCEMERNGVPFNVDLLNSWRSQTRQRFERIIFMIAEQTGLKVNPNSSHDLAKLFGILGLEYGRTPPTPQFPNGQPSFTDDFLKTVKNELVELCREGRTLDSLRSKYLDKYAKALRNGFLYYQLHQLKGDEHYGTISGRYSSSKINIQQVFDPERQADKMGLRDFLVRFLFCPAPGKWWFKADASQIEFRFFVHYSKSERLIKIFNETPDTDFHQQVAEFCHIKRKPAKNINFARLYGAGRDKMALMLNLPRHESDVMFEEYDDRFPETKTLMNEVMRVAKDRGYVKTILGRRARFPSGDRIYSSLNRVLQGSSADYLKLKLLELYNRRRELELLLRLTVHDEIGGDVPSKEHGTKIKAVLEEPIPELKVRVPLTWDVSVSKNWGEASIPSDWKKEGWQPPWAA